MAHVVIVESPSKSKTIHGYLGKDYTVLASFGHIRDLPSKEGSVKPDEDFAMYYELNDGSTKHIKAIADAVKNADSILLATDPDREGEAISWHIIEALRAKRALPKNIIIRRISFNEITKTAILEGIKNPRDIDMDLVNAQQARRALDYLVGFTLSPVLWRKLPGSRSAGRVQSVALRLICERESEIECFIRQEYWDITLSFKTPENKPFTAKLTHIDGDKLDKLSISNRDQAFEITKRLEHKPFTVSSVEGKEVKRNPYPPFTTSTLQQDASRSCGFGAKKTMMIAQRLYEGVNLGGETVGLITYMRTDGVQVSQEAITAARDYIGKTFGASYIPTSPRIYKTKAKNAQEAHEAIRPTTISRTPETVAPYLDDDQLRLYTLIWNRMVASQMASVVMDQVIVTLDNKEHKATARATGSTIRFDGFYRLYQEGKDDDTEDTSRALPPINNHEIMDAKNIAPEQHFTEPPPRYSEATLVKSLEELGIGRPSTYASIISVLQDRNYVRLDKKRFFPEELGRLVTAFLVNFFQRYVEYDFTAKLEEELDDIAAGSIHWKDVLRAFWSEFNTRCQEVTKFEQSMVIQEVEKMLSFHLFPSKADGTLERHCPSCQTGELSLKLGKFGAFLGCSRYPECSYRRAVNTGTDEQGSKDALPEDKVIGTEPVSGLEILLKKGPYGYYVQLGSPKGKEKPKRTSLPKGVTPEKVTFEMALGLISLPRIIGNHPETGKPIDANIGKFGPYIHHEKTYVSLKGDDDVLSIGLNRAVVLLGEKGSAGTRSASEPLRVLGNHPDDGKEIALYKGRYGPYVKHGAVNATIPKSQSPENLTFDEAIALLQAKAGKPPAKKTRKTKPKA